MSRDEVRAGLQSIFRELFVRDSIVLSDETTAKDIPDWDSINHVYLVVAVEQRFGVALTLKDISRLNSVGQFVDLIASKRG